jgi:hypothetical protein
MVVAHLKANPLVELATYTHMGINKYLRCGTGEDPPLPCPLVGKRACADVPHRKRQRAGAAYTYFRRDENEARQANVLTHDGAWRIAANIAKLPELLSRKADE